MWSNVLTLDKIYHIFSTRCNVSAKPINVSHPHLSASNFCTSQNVMSWGEKFMRYKITLLLAMSPPCLCHMFFLSLLLITLDPSALGH